MYQRLPAKPRRRRAGRICRLAPTLALILSSANARPAAAQVCDGNVILRNQAEVDAFDCTEVTAALYITAQESDLDLSPLSKLTSVGRFVSISGLSIANLQGLGGLESVGQFITIQDNPGLTSLEGLSALASLGGSLSVQRNEKLASLDGLDALETIGQGIGINDNPLLTSIQALNAVQSVGGAVEIQRNGVTSLAGLGSITTFPDRLTISTNPGLSSLDGLSATSVGGDFTVQDNANLISVEGLGGLASVGGDLRLGSNPLLTSLSALSGLTSVGGDLIISVNEALESLAGMESVTSIGGQLSIFANPSLTSLESLESLQSVGGDLVIISNNSLSTLDGLERITSVGGNLSVSGNAGLIECGCGLAGLISGDSFTGVAGDLVQIASNAWPTAGGRCNSPEEVVELGCPCILDWKNTAGGEFFTVENWLAEKDPKDYDAGDACDVRFDTGASSGYTVTMNEAYTSGSLSVGRDLTTLNLGGHTYDAQPPTPADTSLRIGFSPGEAGSLLLTNGTLASDGGTAAVGLSGGSGSLIISSGAEVRVSEAGDVGELHVGSDSNSTGYVLLEEGGKLFTSYVAVIGSDSTATGDVDVDGTGSTWEARHATVGFNGEGALTVRDGGRATLDFLYAGQNEDSHGRIQVTGSGSTLELPDEGEVVIGDEGEAELTVESAAQFIQGAGQVAIVGSKEKSQGTVTIRDSGSKWKTEGLVAIGGDGAGTLHVEAGGEAEFPWMTVANRSESSESESIGVVRVSGSGSRFSLTFEDYQSVVSRGGTGILQVLDGAHASVAANLLVGAEAPPGVPPGNGTLEVEDSGSRLEVSGVLALGDRGRGSASIRNGGFVRADEVWIGFLDLQPAMTSTIDISDTDSRLEVDRLIVGGGTGTLNVTNGGRVSATDVTIAHSPEPAPASGHVSVSGTGSTLTAGRIHVGPGGAGDLFVTGGGVVQANLIYVHGTGNVESIGGSLFAPLMSVGGPTPSKNAEASGIRVDTLFLGDGAVLEVDSLVLRADGLLGGSTAWTIPLVNPGTLSPGDSVGGTATLTLAAGFRQEPTGVVEIDLRGTGAGAHDRLEVTGVAAVGGLLRLRASGGYLPKRGDRFEIIAADSVTGTFEAIESLLDVPVEAIYGPRSVELEILQSVAAEEEPVTPQHYALAQNYPNPFSASTAISFSLPHAAMVRLSIYDLLGREVARLHDGPANAGIHQITLDAQSLPSQTYFYRLETGTFSETRRMVVAR